MKVTSEPIEPEVGWSWERAMAVLTIILAGFALVCQYLNLTERCF